MQKTSSKNGMRTWSRSTINEWLNRLRFRTAPTLGLLLRDAPANHLWAAVLVEQPSESMDSRLTRHTHLRRGGESGDTSMATNIWSYSVNSFFKGVPGSK